MGEQICSKYIVCTYKLLKELMKMYFQKVYQGKIRRESISFLLTAPRMCGYGARAGKWINKNIDEKCALVLGMPRGFVTEH